MFLSYGTFNGKWFEPRSLSRLCGLIVSVRVVPKRTLAGDIDRSFDNLSGSHYQNHVNCVLSVYGIYVSGQLNRDVIGFLAFFYKYATGPYMVPNIDLYFKFLF